MVSRCLAWTLASVVLAWASPSWAQNEVSEKPLTEEALPEGDSPLAKTNKPAPDITTTPEPLPIEAPELIWKPEWAKSGLGNYLLIGGATATAITGAIVGPSSTHHLTGDILFDESARKALRLKSLNDRYTARDASDVLLSLGTLWPYAVDSLIVANGVHRSPDVAWEMAVIDAEAMAMTVALQQMTTLFVSRPRPYVEDCNVTLSPDLNDCVRSSRFRSFYSGHTSMAFTSASLVCAHRARLTLFGPTADVVMCAGAFVAATATATLRIMGDMHNASDVIVGALVGTAVGLGVPALHYANHDRSTASLLPGGYELSVYPTGTGVGLAVVY